MQEASMAQDPREREREFDAITFVLAAVLASVVLGAVGYGIYKSSKVATAIPGAVTTTGTR
jgi:FlaG/FlaF family flagellin (archaellin)